MSRPITDVNQNLISDFTAKIHSSLQYAGQSESDRVQTDLFLKHLTYTSENSPFYKDVIRKNKIDITQIKTHTDIVQLPFTEKSDMNGENSFLAVPEHKIVDICLTSATSGSTPTMISQTESDLSRLAYNEELAFGMAGVTKHDTMLICAAIDRCFMAGIAYFLGGIKLKARILRGGSGSAAQHWELIKLGNVTVIVGVPSLIYKIGQYALEEGKDPSKTNVRKLIAIGEQTRDKDLNLLPVSEELENMWGANVYSTYASSELATTFCECKIRSGGHLRPELNLLEIISDDGKALSDGDIGEVVTTPLGVTGMPLIRFKTGDISYIINKPCSCGRTTKRLGPIIGRKNQMLKYKGTTLFPNSVISALEGDSRFHGGYVEALKNNDGTDRVILYASLSDPELNETWIKETLRAKIRVVPELKIISKEKTDKKVYQFDKKRKRITFYDLR